MAKPTKKKKSKRLLFVLEMVILLVFILGLVAYGQISSRLQKIDTPVFEEEKIEINPEVKESISASDSELSGYSTYALFGLDTRSVNTSVGGMNSDTMIVASINNDTGVVKLVSLYRDTLLDIGDNIYSKANAAYAYGGPEQAISMMNTCLDLSITDYVTVNFGALVDAIDDLDGLDVPLSYAEIVHLNNYAVETSKETGHEYTQVELPAEVPADQEAIIGTYHLNGVQAVSYCRIRYTASLDMGRTQRQRYVLMAIVQKAKNAGLTEIFKIMDDVLPQISTSLSSTDIFALIPAMIGFEFGETEGFPTEYVFSDIKGDVIVPTDLITNVEELHKFLYGDNVSYTPSSKVQEISAQITELKDNGGTSSNSEVTIADNSSTDSYYEETEGSSTNAYDSSTETYSDGSSTDTSGNDTSYDNGGSTDTGNGYEGDTSGYNDGTDTSGTDTSGGDTSGGDTSGGDTSGGDTSGGDTSGGDMSGGDSSGADMSGGDSSGGDMSGGDASGGEYSEG